MNRGLSSEAMKKDMEDVYRSICNVDVSEIFSPVRVTGHCKIFGLKPGSAMDLATGWDFDRASDRARAAEVVMKEKPKLLIGSPPCTFFSQLQELNKARYKDNQK